MTFQGFSIAIMATIFAAGAILAYVVKPHNGEYLKLARPSAALYLVVLAHEFIGVEIAGIVLLQGLTIALLCYNPETESY